MTTAPQALRVIRPEVGSPLGDGLDYLISRISQANGDALLTDALTRLAVLSANRPDNQAKFDHFEREFRLERGRLRLLAAIPLARRIDG